jgi:pyruvate dehydrogenase E2 component (dihydrolipoamide acetyltransferase)
MSVNIEMPKLSDTMTEGTLVKWHKQVGDTVEIGDIIAEVETDKATMEMEAFDEGVITEILIKQGDKAPIGSILAVLDGDNGSAPAASTTAAPAATSTPVSTSSGEQSAAVAPTSAAPAQPSGERTKASPLARKIAADLGVDLSKIAGSGPAGRIVESDVQAAAKAPAKAPAAAPSSEAAAAAGLAASVKSKATTPAPASAPAATPAVQAINPVAKEGDLAPSHVESYDPTLLSAR